MLQEFTTLADEIGDKDDGIFTLLANVVERLVGNVSVVEYWQTADPEDPAVGESHALLNALLAGPLDRARGPKMIAADLEAEDLFLAFRMITGTLQGRDVEQRTIAGRRALRIVMHGLLTGDQDTTRSTRIAPTSPSDSST